MRIAKTLAALLAGTGLIWFGNEVHEKHLAWSDFTIFFYRPTAVAALPPGTSFDAQPGDSVQFIRLTKYQNDARAVVTHTIDDTTSFVPRAIETMDRYGIKATIFISTDWPMGTLWTVLSSAVENGHEIGSHSRTHPCLWPPSRRFCFFSYSDWELTGSRDEILRQTPQPYVWSFAYPCGLCSNYEFVHRKLERAGYVVARNYPNEAGGGHNVPDMQTWDPDCYNATYTQAVQKKGGIAPSGRTDVTEINRKFDEVYGKGGIYHFVSHPQWLDYGRDGFYEQHIRYVSNRPDIWYVPMGPLYVYQRVVERTRIRRLGPERFEAVHDLPARTFPISVTLEFSASTEWAPEVNGRLLGGHSADHHGRWDGEYYRRHGTSLFITLHPPATLTFSSLRVP